MQHKKSVYTTAIMAFLMFSVVSASMPMAKAAGTITLTPTTQTPAASVTVDGTGFGATKAVGIGFGAEVNVIDEPFNMTGPFGTGYGPYTGTVPHLPIKPGTFRKSENLSGTIFTLFDIDNGNGTFSVNPAFAASFENGTINYVTGEYTLFTKIMIPSNLVYRINYTYYQYNVTPAAGVTTLGSGAFTASITVPSVDNGNYAVTAIDTQGNLATATLSVDNTIPEGLTIEIMVLLSSVALIVSSRYFRKRPKNEKCRQVKL